ncbi:MAG TPA: phage tail sheath subtilisin-like domain-containing protein, partial [Mycobacterium sp.]|nr:phage tail sheath subtilisin-like domain-containing protein [Mycobacterium sp.]
MPPTLQHPGVYVEELKSGVRPITGVATSITAFVGRALRGPVDTPVTLTSFGDFERTFGGLWTDSHLGYSVRDFFRLGGSTAVVVRVHATAANDVATVNVGTGNRQLKLLAASPGSWGAKLTATVDTEVMDLPAPDPTLFNLTVTDTGSNTTEVFRNVSFAAGAARRVDLVVNAQSALVRVDTPLPTQPQNAPPVTAAASANTTDGGAISAPNITTGANFERDKKGLYALEKTDLFNLLVIPPYNGAGLLPGAQDVEDQVVTDAIAYAGKRRAVVVLDPPTAWTTPTLAHDGAVAAAYPTSRNAATYFPRIKQPDPLHAGQVVQFAPSGAITGLIAATDAARGVWKAPAGLDTVLAGVVELAVPMSDGDIDQLNPIAVNCLRVAAGAGHVMWGARTREGDDRQGSEWKYLPVRRTALFLEESL